MNDNLNLLITFYSDHYQHAEEKNRENFKDITWSPFDRVVFRSVNSLEELCCYNGLSKASCESNMQLYSQKPDKKLENKETASKSNMVQWTGVKQCMHLVEEKFDNTTMPESKWDVKARFELNDGDNLFEVTKDENNPKFDFYCIYSIRFSNHIQNLLQNGQVWNKKEIREEVFKKICEKFENKINGNQMNFKCFRSLGSEDMVIIFLAKSMKDIVSVCETVNKLKIKLPESIFKKLKKSDGQQMIDNPSQLFSTVSVFSGLNNPKCDKLTDTDLIIHLNLKNGNNLTCVKDEIAKEITITLNKNESEENIDLQSAENKFDKWFVLLGLGTVIVHLPAGCVRYTAFQSKGIFNGESQFYKTNLYNSRTYFCYPTSTYGDIEPLDIDMNELVLDDANSDSNESDNTGNEVARFIFDEYERLTSSQRTLQWHKILSNQLNAIKRFSNYYFKENLKFEACDLLNYAQSSLHLINQACSPASEMPNHNHFYSGSFHDIIKTYYGIINMIFDIGEIIPHDSSIKPHKIDFVICLNSTARIESKIFTRRDKPFWRFIVFFLPYDDFWNFSGNIKFLIHEVFHYIAPYSRDLRGKYFVKVMYSMLVNKEITRLYNSVSDQEVKPSLVEAVKNWKEWLIKKYYNTKKNDLVSELNNSFHNFFIAPNPEWRMLYLNYTGDTYHGDNKSPVSFNAVVDILTMIDVRVQEDIISSLDSMLGNLSSSDIEVIQKNFSLDHIKNCFFSQSYSNNQDNPSKTIIKRISIELQRYDLATKEAFCDMWSILISGLSIPEYIVIVLKKMAETNPKESILSSIKANSMVNAPYDIRGTIIRLLLLMHKYIMDSHSKRSCSDVIKNPELIFSNVKDKDEYISHCVAALADRYLEFVKIAQYEIDSLYNIAFYNIDESFKAVLKNESGKRYQKLKDAAKINLTHEIGMWAIDMFSGYTSSDIVKFQGEITCSYKKDYTPKEFHPINQDEKYNMWVTCFGDVLDSIKQIRDIVSPNKSAPHTMWYRGVCSDKYGMLPSIFRKGNLDISVYANQANVIKRAYFSTLYASDIWNLPIEQKMAYLQHYGIPTNLLDFSVDPFAALHFSLNPDVPSDREKISDGKFQPVIYVFDPIIYGKAIRRMAVSKPFLNIPDSISAVEFDINNSNKGKSAFFVNDMSFEYLSEHNNKHIDTYVPDIRIDPFPVPFAIQQSNNRFAAQSGTFVAYSLDSCPQDDISCGKFDYLDLLTIQKRYISFLAENGADCERFLFPIYLDKNFIGRIRDELKTLNIKTGKYYPELSRIFDDSKSDWQIDGI